MKDKNIIEKDIYEDFNELLVLNKLLIDNQLSIGQEVIIRTKIKNLLDKYEVLKKKIDN